MDKIKILSLFLFASISTSAFSEDIIITENGHLLDDEYYSALEGVVIENPAPQLRNNTAVFERSFKFKILSKGAFLYNFAITWNDAQGQRHQHTRNYVSAWIGHQFDIPAGARSVHLNVIVHDAFFGNQIISRTITPESVAKGYPNFTEYHLWGSTLFPKWSMVD